MANEMVSVKLVFVGDGITGKTPFLLTLVNGMFPDQWHPTVFDIWDAEVEAEFPDGVIRPVTLCLYDTNGTEDYARLRPLSYPDTDLFVVTYGVDSVGSLQNVSETWLPEIQNSCPGHKTSWVLLGLKTDLRKSVDHMNTRHPIVDEDLARRVAKKFGAVEYFECSPRTGDGFNEAVKGIARVALACKYGSHTGPLSFRKKLFNWFSLRRSNKDKTRGGNGVPVDPNPCVQVDSSTFRDD